MGESRDKSFEENLAQLERDGFLLLKNVLDMETVQKWRDSLYRRYERGEYDRRNSGRTRCIPVSALSVIHSSRSMPLVMTALSPLQKIKSV